MWLEFYQINNIQKDIDFICIGRFQKFKGLEKIWQIGTTYKKYFRKTVTGDKKSFSL